MLGVLAMADDTLLRITLLAELPDDVPGEDVLDIALEPAALRRFLLRHGDGGVQVQRHALAAHLRMLASLCDDNLGPFANYPGKPQTGADASKTVPLRVLRARELGAAAEPATTANQSIPVVTRDQAVDAYFPPCINCGIAAPKALAAEPRLFCETCRWPVRPIDPGDPQDPSAA